MAKITGYELGDLIESADWLARNFHTKATCGWERNNYNDYDMPGPMSPAQVVDSIRNLVKEYDKVYKLAYVTIPIPHFFTRITHWMKRS